jgi:hypothetical protein
MLSESLCVALPGSKRYALMMLDVRQKTAVHCALNSLLIDMLVLTSQWIAPTEDNITYLQTIFRTSPPLKTANIDGKPPNGFRPAVCHLLFVPPSTNPAGCAPL